MFLLAGFMGGVVLTFWGVKSQISWECSVWLFNIISVFVYLILLVCVCLFNIISVLFI